VAAITISSIPEPTNVIPSCTDAMATAIVGAKSDSIQTVIRDTVDGNPVTGVTRVLAGNKRVIGNLASSGKTTVFGPVPASGESRQKVDTKLVLSALRQLVKTLIADPVVVTLVSKTDFELFPRAVEERRGTNVLLD